MQLGKAWFQLAIVFVLGGWYLPLTAQPYSTIEVKKTGKYENRLLPAEKTGNKGFPIPKRLYNNSVSHFNYFFNAQQRWQQAIDQAKQGFRENYAQLLPFFPYDMGAVSANEMDTVIYKCTAGILLHDLRSDWVDQFYLLMAKAYLHKKQFDSASLVLQYLNYAFAPKDDGYDLFLGSNSNAPGGQFTVSSPEKRSVWSKLSAPSPARNEGLLLQARVWTESGEWPKAAALLGLLDGDPLFPKRLAAEKAMAKAHLFYAEKNVDSAANALLQSLSLAENPKEKARDYFLAGQLKALSNQPQAAIPLFEKAIQYHADPLMEVYARLQLIALANVDQPNRLQENLDALLKMAKKGIYQPYLDILYYTAAGLEIKRNQFAAASGWMQKCLAVSDGEPRQRQMAWWRWADLLYHDKKYLAAAQAFDSIQLDLLTPADQEKVSRQKPAMSALAQALTVVQENDSLLRIAALPESERWTYLNALAKKMNQKKGIPATETNMGGSGLSSGSEESLFGNNNDFYFDNGTLKSRGLGEFQAKWGNRPNIDNWRRQSAVDRNITGFTAVSDATPAVTPVKNENQPTSPDELAQNLPLDSLAKMATWKKMAAAYAKAIQLFRLSLDDEPAAQDMETRAQQKIPFWSSEKEGVSPVSTKAAEQKVNVAYEKIYQQFLAGDFKNALAAKQVLEKENAQLTWTPQLLYMEALYLVKQGEDSLAKQNLKKMVQFFPGHVLTEKAIVLEDVLSRKKEIVAHLEQIDIQRPEEDPKSKIVLSDPISLPTAIPKTKALPVTTSKVAQPPILSPLPKPNATPMASADGFRFVANDTQFVALVLFAVDPLYMSEARNALNRYNRDQYNPSGYGTRLENIQEKINYLLMGPFADAAKADNYLQALKPKLANSVLPWLPANQYRLLIISPANLRILQREKNHEKYLAFLQNLFPDKF